MPSSPPPVQGCSGLTLLVREGSVEKVWYPVFPPDRHAAEVLGWLRANPAPA